MVLFLLFWETTVSNLFIAGVKLLIIYVKDVQISMVKRSDGLSGCHRESLIFLVRPEFFLDVGSAQRG